MEQINVGGNALEKFEFVFLKYGGALEKVKLRILACWIWLFFR